MLPKRLVIAGTKKATDLRPLAQRAEVIRADELQLHSLGRSRSVSASARLDEYGFDAALCGDIGPAAQEFDGTLDDGVPELLLELVGLCRLRDVEVLRVGDRQRTQHDCVDKRKNGAARSDPKRQRQDRDCGETGTSDEEAGAKAQISEKMFDWSERSHIAAGLLHGIDAPHLAPSAPLGISGVISTRHFKTLQLLEMKTQLLIELLLDYPTSHERAKRRENATRQARRHTSYFVSRSVVTADDNRRH